MKQRVVGAIAISGHPEVLIADEPTTALDVTIQLQYLKLLKRLQHETGMAILFITHDFGVVARMCDRVAVMYAGRIVECGPVADVFENPSHPYTQALIASVPKMTGSAGRLYTIEGQPPSLMDLPAGCRFAPRCAYAEERCRDAYPGSVTVGAGTHRRLLAAARGRQWRLPPRSHPAAGRPPSACPEVSDAQGRAAMHATPCCGRAAQAFPFTKGMLFARNLGHVKAVDDVSFTIDAGETLGLVGESGCGKTTTSRLILNLEEPTERPGPARGRADPRPSGRGSARLPRQGAGGVPGPWSSLNPRMKVGRTIAESLIVTAGATARNRRAGARAAAQVGLRPEQAEQYPHEFSGGQRQRVALAGALASRPRLIVLDEPVSALDVSIRAQMMNLLKDIQAQDNVAYLLVAHDLATVRHMADHTVVMYLGKIVEQAPTAALFDDVRHPYTKALFSAVLAARPGQRGGGDRAHGRGAVAARSADRLPLPHALPLCHAAMLARGAGIARGLTGPRVACHLYRRTC